MTTQWICRFLGLLLMFTTAGCGGNKTLNAVSADYEKDITRGIRKHIDDEDRKDKLLGLENEIKQLNLQIERLYLDAGNQIRNTPKLSETEIAGIMDAFSQARKLKLNEVGKIRQEMRALTSKAEWNAFFNSGVSK